MFQAPAEKTVQTPEEKTVQTPEEKTVKTPEEKTVQTPEEKTVQTPEDKTVQASEEKTVQTPEEKTVQAPEEKTVQTPEEKTVQTPEEKTVQTPEEKTVQAPEEKTVQAPEEKTVQAPEEKTVQTPEEKTVQTPEEKTVQTPEEKTVQTPEEKTVQTPEEKTVQAPEEKTVQAPEEKTVQTPEEKTVQTPEEKTVQAPEEKTVQAPEEKSVQAPGEKTVQTPEEKTVQTPEKKTVQTPEEKTVQAPEEKTVQAPEEKSVQAPGEKTVQTPEEKTVQAPEEKTVQTPEEKTVQTPEDKTVQTPEEKTVQTPEEKTVQTPEEKTVQTPEEKTVQTPEEKTVQTPDEQDQAPSASGEQNQQGYIPGNIVIYNRKRVKVVTKSDSNVKIHFLNVHKRNDKWVIPSDLTDIPEDESQSDIAEETSFTPGENEIDFDWALDSPDDIDPAPDSVNEFVYECLNNNRQVIGTAKIISDREECHGRAVDCKTEVIIEVLNVTGYLDNDVEEYSEFEVGSYRIFKKLDLRKIQIQGSNSKTKGRGRKRTRSPEKWKRAVTKKLRDSGESYTTIKSKKLIPAKEFKWVDCQCKTPNCRLVDEEERKKEYVNFYKKTYKDQNLYVALNVNTVHPKKVTVNSVTGQPSGRKKFTRIFMLNGKRVCKKVFIGTLQYSNGRLDRLLKRGQDGVDVSREGRGKHTNRPKKVNENVRALIRDVLESMPKYTTHYKEVVYTAEDTVYLPPMVTFDNVYSICVTEIRKNELQVPSKDWFLRYMKCEYPNLKKKAKHIDTCNVCDRVDKSDEEKVEHRQVAKDAIDLCKHDSKKEFTFIFDMMSTLPLPKLESNLAFYKRQLWMYVEGLHNDLNNTGYMYTWLESQSGKGSREVCNVLYQHFLALKYTKYILWCDSTVSQNRNSIIANFLAYCVNSLPELKTVIIRFFETGHSYNSGDRDFGLMKKKIISEQNIYTQDKYIELIEAARKKPSPFHVHKMEKFQDFDNTLPYAKRPDPKTIIDNDGVAVKWFKVKEMRFTEGLLGFRLKYNFRDEQYKIVDYEKGKRKKRGAACGIRDASSVNKITQAKYNDLMDLMKYVPPIHQQFYIDLPHHG